MGRCSGRPDRDHRTAGAVLDRGRRRVALGSRRSSRNPDRPGRGPAAGPHRRDEAMRRAKRRGRGLHQFFQADGHGSRTTRSRHAPQWRTAVESRKSAVTYRSGGANCERRLSLPLSPRRPSFRFSSPLIEPGVRISRTRLSDGFHVKACARAERTARAAASTPAWPSRRAPVGASGFFRELTAKLRLKPPSESPAPMKAW